MRSAAAVEVKDAKLGCKEHGLETDYWFEFFESYHSHPSFVKFLPLCWINSKRCLDHSTLVCQHCLIFGAHRGDNAQTVEHRSGLLLLCLTCLISTNYLKWIFHPGLMWAAASTIWGKQELRFHLSRNLWGVWRWKRGLNLWRKSERVCFNINKIKGRFW